MAMASLPHFFLQKNWGFLILRLGFARSLRQELPDQRNGRNDRHGVKIRKPWEKGEGRTT
jgi:hypothetical protein